MPITTVLQHVKNKYLYPIIKHLLCSIMYWYLLSSTSSVILMVALSCPSGMDTAESKDVSAILKFSTSTSRTLTSSNIDTDMHCLSFATCPEVKINSSETEV